MRDSDWTAYINQTKGGYFAAAYKYTHEQAEAEDVVYSVYARLLEKEYHLIDCQMYTAHLTSLGAIEIPRASFLEYL